MRGSVPNAIGQFGVKHDCCARLRSYWTLIKSLQTGLLLVTGLAGYMSARCPVIAWQTMVGLTGSLFLAISGSTVLNMVYDRDIDLCMGRTCLRPLPPGRVSVREAVALGILLSVAGVAWALALSPLYGLVVFAGLFCDVVVYTLWLKRRTAWSIVWGGIAGGMPILAGRVLGTWAHRAHGRAAESGGAAVDSHPHHDLQHPLPSGLRPGRHSHLPSAYGVRQ